MTIEQIRDIQTPDLVAKVSELKQELFALRFQQGSGQMKQEDSGKIREIKCTTLCVAEQPIGAYFI